MPQFSPDREWEALVRIRSNGSIPEHPMCGWTWADEAGHFWLCVLLLGQEFVCGLSLWQTPGKRHDWPRGKMCLGSLSSCDCSLTKDFGNDFFFFSFFLLMCVSEFALRFFSIFFVPPIFLHASLLGNSLDSLCAAPKIVELAISTNQTSSSSLCWFVRSVYRDPLYTADI